MGSDLRSDGPGFQAALLFFALRDLLLLCELLRCVPLERELVDLALLVPVLLLDAPFVPVLLAPELLVPELPDPERLDSELLDPEPADREPADREFLDRELVEPERVDPVLLDPLPLRPRARSATLSGWTSLLKLLTSPSAVFSWYTSSRLFSSNFSKNSSQEISRRFLSFLFTASGKQNRKIPGSSSVCVLVTSAGTAPRASAHSRISS